MSKAGSCTSRAGQAAGGVFKHAYDGNWKLYLENLCDAAHPLFVHQSSIEAAKAQPDDVF